MEVCLAFCLVKADLFSLFHGPACICTAGFAADIQLSTCEYTAVSAADTLQFQNKGISLGFAFQIQDSS